MADCEIKHVPTVVLRLSTEEAIWLRAYLQNSRDPDPYSSEMRQAIFTELPDPNELLQQVPAGRGNN